MITAYISTCLFLVSCFIKPNKWAQILFAYTLIITSFYEFILPLPVDFLTLVYGTLLGTCLGIGTFILSCFMTSATLTASDAPMLISSLLQAKLRPLLASHLFVAFSEELVWRVCLQSVAISLFGMWGGIAVTAILFWLLHWENFQSLWQRQFEFLLFSLLLGSLFALTQNFMFVIMIHATRNWLILAYRSNHLQKNQLEKNPPL
jgi:membrane protease YdiL (CAAX protease family)